MGKAIRELAFEAQRVELSQDKLIIYNNSNGSPFTFPVSTCILAVKDGTSTHRILRLVHIAGDGQNPSSVALQSISVKGPLPGELFPTIPLFQDLSSMRNALKSLVSTDGPDHDDKPRIHILSTFKSGTGLALDFCINILEPLLNILSMKLDVDFTHTKTVNPRAAWSGDRNIASDSLLPDANAGRQSLVLLATGDGGVFDLLNGPLARGLGSSAKNSSYCAPTICLFPLGTGNALFHSIHRSHTTPVDPLINAIRTLFTGTPRPLPTFVASFSPGSKILSPDQSDPRLVESLPPPYGCAEEARRCLFGAVVASHCFHATLVADSDLPEYREHGIARFGMVAQKLLNDQDGGPHPYKCDIHTDPEPNSGDNILSHHPRASVIQDGRKTGFGYILLTLVSNLEPSFVISPETKPVDGRLRAVIFAHQSGEKVGELMAGAYAGGKHVEDERIFYAELPFAQIRTNEDDASWRKVCVDGTIIELEKGGKMNVLMSFRQSDPAGPNGDGILKVLVPSSEPLPKTEP